MMTWMLGLISFCGACLSLLSVYEHVNVRAGLGGVSAFCNISAGINCAGVINSPFSEFLGLPLGAYGFAFYLVSFGLFLAGRRAQKPARALLVLSFVAVLLSLLLFAISKFLLGTLCPVCLGMYLCNFALYFLSRKAQPGRIGPLLREGVSAIVGWASGLVSADRARRSAAYPVLLRVVLVILLSALLPGLIAGYIVGPSQLSAAWLKNPVQEFKPAPENAVSGDYVKGPADAPVKIVEFSDLECPGCRRSFRVLEDLLVAYPGKISITFRNFPLDRSCNRLLKREIHRHACFAAEFARCAGEQGRFWDVVNYLASLTTLETERDFMAVRESIRRADTVLTLDNEALDECMKSGRQRERIKSDIEEGISLEIAANPAVWINGRRVENPNEETLRAIVKAIIKGAQ